MLFRTSAGTKLSIPGDNRRPACCRTSAESFPGLSTTPLPWHCLIPVYPVLAGSWYPAAVSTTLWRVHQWRVQHAIPALLQRGQARLDRLAAAASLEQQRAPWPAARCSRAAQAAQGSRRAAPPPVLQGSCARPPSIWRDDDRAMACPVRRCNSPALDPAAGQLGQVGRHLYMHAPCT